MSRQTLYRVGSSSSLFSVQPIHPLGRVGVGSGVMDTGEAVVMVILLLEGDNVGGFPSILTWVKFVGLLVGDMDGVKEGVKEGLPEGVSEGCIEG